MLALVLLRMGLRATTAVELARLQKRAIGCLLVVNFGAAVGLVKLFGAVGGESSDPSQTARIFAEGVSDALNCIALGIVATPLPLAAIIVMAVRAGRLSREPASP
jgi:hypothetical protein